MADPRDERIEQLETALRPFAEYIELRLSAFTPYSRDAYPVLEVVVAPGLAKSILRQDWERLCVALTPKPDAGPVPPNTQAEGVYGPR